MSNQRSKISVLICMLGLSVWLSACETTSESATPRGTRSDSPWAKRTAATDSAAAPAAESYQADVDADTGTSGGVDMAYQTEQVESVVPVEPMVEEAAAPAADAVIDEPVEAAPVMAKPAPVAAKSAAKNDFAALPSGHYTVQLIASIKESDVRVYAKKNQLASAQVVPTVRNGTTWYVLLLGVYPDKAAAKTAMHEVEGALPSKPWMRTVGSVQQIMP